MEMNTTRYNGWTNYETWAVKLWMDNEEGSYNYWRDGVREAMKRFDDKDSATSALADRLKDDHEDATPEVPGVFSDLLRAALSEVNWHEIAQSLLEDVGVAQ